MTELDDRFNAFLTAADDLEALMLRAASVSPEARQRELLVALNKLELGNLALPDVDEPPGVHEPAPVKVPSTLDKRREQVLAAFPEFKPYYAMGMYREENPPRELSDVVMFGDATGDLTQILSDIDYIRWIARNEERAHAVWWAKWSYDDGISETLADLRAYISRLRNFVP